MLNLLAKNRRQRTTQGSEKKPLIVVIPVYKASLNGVERARFRVSEANFRGDVVFLAPHGLDLATYRALSPGARIQLLAPEWFASQAMYSALMTQSWLYKIFSSYEFMLVYQFDAILTSPVPLDGLRNLDYVGAPWIPPFRLWWNPFTSELSAKNRRGFRRTVDVGNGGLSVRRVTAFRRAASLIPKIRSRTNEDLIFAFFARFTRLRVADVAIARLFFMESEAEIWNNGDALPKVFGYHALEKHNPALEAKILEGFTEA